MVLSLIGGAFTASPGVDCGARSTAAHSLSAACVAVSLHCTPVRDLYGCASLQMIRLLAIFLGACVVAPQLSLPPPPRLPPPAAAPSPAHVDSAAVSIAVGAEFACAARTDGAVDCWGARYRTTQPSVLGGAVYRRVPVPVAGVTGAVEVAAGERDACARIADGTVRCWGPDMRAALGATLAEAPCADQGTCWTDAIAVPGIAGAVEIAVTDAAGCARLADGSVRCWGRVEAPTVTGATRLTHGGLFCATQADGHAQCWGRPWHAFDGFAPAVETVAAGLETCEIAADRTVHCAASDAHHATAVPGATDARALVSTGSESWCALRGDGAVLCWGRNDNDLLGAVALGELDARAAAAPIAGLPAATQVAAGWRTACILGRAGDVWCWGGALGIADPLNNAAELDGPFAPDAVTVRGLTDAVDLDATAHHACAVRRGGTVACWGRNNEFQLGDGTTHARTTPVPVAGIADAVHVVTARERTCALLRDGTVRCWGQTPVTLDAAIHVVQLAVEDSSVCVVRDDHRALCTGRIAELMGATGLAPIPGPADVAEIALVGEAACVRTLAGHVECFGYGVANNLGRAGTNGRVVRERKRLAIPERVEAIGGVDGFAGWARTASGAVYAWGGLEIVFAPMYRAEPIRIPFDGAARVVAAGWRACLEAADGVVRCKGDGIDSSRGREHPFAAVRGLEGAVQLAVGKDMQCGRMPDGTVRCSGVSRYGELGDGTALFSPDPVRIALP